MHTTLVLRLVRWGAGIQELDAAAALLLPQGSSWENRKKFLPCSITGSRPEKKGHEISWNGHQQTLSGTDMTQSAGKLNIISWWSNVFSLVLSPSVYVRYYYAANWSPLIREHLTALPLCWQGWGCCFLGAASTTGTPPTQHLCWGEQRGLWVRVLCMTGRGDNTQVLTQLLAPLLPAN